MDIEVVPEMSLPFDNENITVDFADDEQQMQREDLEEQNEVLPLDFFSFFRNYGRILDLALIFSFSPSIE